MLTSRGWWFLVVVGFILVLGVAVLPAYTVGPAVVALPLLLWFGFEWAVFQSRTLSALPRLRVTRRLIQSDREVPTVWAGVAFEVRVEVEHNGAAALPFVLLEDRVPQAADRWAGEPGLTADLRPHDPARITYTLKCPAPGVVRFEGVRVRVADLHGFFYRRAFLRDEAEYLVLPPLSDDEGRQRADKRFNTLPPPGAHRLRRPGSGGELLTLRDYQPGDPPKMIAWKASARRDTLITKEYESDVPVRCVLFLDTSQGVRVGPPGGTALVRLVTVAAGVAQAAAAGRDLVGLTTFDEDGTKAVAPARTKLHMTGLLRTLAEAAARTPDTADIPPDLLTLRALPLAHELYPELMNTRANRMPWGRLWRPLLDKWWGWAVLGMMLLPATLFASLYYLQKWYFVPYIQVLAAGTMALTRMWGSGTISVIIPLPTKLVFGLFLLWLPTGLGGLIWVVHGVRGWFGAGARRLTERKRLAALFAVQDGTGPAGVERLIHDDAAYVARVGRFLAERQVRVPVPLYDDRGRFRFKGDHKAAVLAGAITAAVSRARDNELYVILADLAELGRPLEAVVNAARVARARRHQVLVIVPWPADVPPPDAREPAAAAPQADPTEPLRRRFGLPRRPPNLAPLVQAALTRQYHAHFLRLRRALGRAGAVVVRVGEEDSVQLVLDRLDRVRGLRSRR